MTHCQSGASTFNNLDYVELVGSVMLAFMFDGRLSSLWIGLCVTLLVGCSDSPSNPDKTSGAPEDPTAAEKPSPLAIGRKDMSGEQLAHAFCQTCHLFPEPDAFDKATWRERLFPLMGPRLGIYRHGSSTYRDFREESTALAGRTDIFPDDPQLTETEWQKLMDWYAAAAPDQPLPQDEHEKIGMGLKQFKASFPPKTDKRAPMATVVKMDPLTGNIYVSNAISNSLTIYDKKFKVLNTIEFESPPIHLRFDPGNGPEQRGLWLTEIGSLRPTNDPTGKLHYMYFRPDASIVEPRQTPIDRLIRPVFSTFADLDNDHQPDIVISEFGWHIGALNWYQNLGGDRMQKHSLKQEPGAISSYVYDFDGNGFPDVIALMAQGNEGIFMFWNDGNDNFREQQLLKFPPLLGFEQLRAGRFQQ